MVLNGGRRLLIALAVVACALAWWNLATASDAVGGDFGAGAGTVRGTAAWQASVARQDAMDAQLNTHHGSTTTPRVLLHEEDLAAALEPANPRHVLMERTAFYCNSHPFRNLTASPLDPTPAELVIPQYADRELVLVQVHTYIRHGDRANLADPYGSPPNVECSLVEPPSPAFAPSWPRVMASLAAGFEVQGDAEGKLFQEVFSPLDVDRKAAAFSKPGSSTSSRKCRRADLTTKGVVQQLENGALLGAAYKEALGLKQGPVAAAASGALVVESTKFQRTILSAAAIVTGFFMNNVGDEASGEPGPVPIQMCLEESCLVFATKVSHTVCPKSSRFQKASGHVSNMWHVTSTSTQQNVLEMLGKPLTSYPIAHHVDSIFSRMCHGINQVCVKGGQCLTAADAVDIIAAGDAEFFDRYSRPYSRIVMYPFFFDLLSKMSDAAHERSTLKLHIAAVHDTVVMPLLVILGVSDGRWPPYASRLVFEVWRVPQIPKVGDLENYTFLRLLYHGMDITGRLACSNHPSTKKGFCSLATFRKQVQDMLGPFPTYEEACAKSASR